VYVIEYDGTFTFAAPLAEVWATMAQTDCYPSWWSWLQEFSHPSRGLEPGARLRGVVAPPVPYRMRLEVVLEECVPEKFLTARVHGDLEGRAELSFDGDERETHAHAAWTIEMMQRPMRVAARLAHPMLRWGHDRVVDATVDGFRRQLMRRS
jgi:hypothetical protein